MGEGLGKRRYNKKRITQIKQELQYHSLSKTGFAYRRLISLTGSDPQFTNETYASAQGLTYASSINSIQVLFSKISSYYVIGRPSEGLLTVQTKGGLGVRLGVQVLGNPPQVHQKVGVGGR